MNPYVTLAAAALLVATGTPVAADEHDGGVPCGVTATRDQRGSMVDAVLYGGPWYVRPPRPGVEVTLRCVVEVETENGPVRVAQVSAGTALGVAVVPPSPASFSVAESVNLALFVCTEIEVYDPLAIPAYEVRRYDADGNASNGAQCAKREPDDRDLVYVYDETSGNGDSCFVADHNLGSPVPERYCLPV